LSSQGDEYVGLPDLTSSPGNQSPPIECGEGAVPHTFGTERLLGSSGEEFAPGDRIVRRRNDQALGLTNGTRGVVTHIDSRAGELQITTDRGDTVHVRQSYLDAGHLQLGYAIPWHVAQGLTAERAVVLAIQSGAQKEWVTSPSAVPAATPASTSPRRTSTRTP
jgi:hypothetical protein